MNRLRGYWLNIKVFALCSWREHAPTPTGDPTLPDGVMFCRRCGLFTDCGGTPIWVVCEGTAP